MHYLKLCHKILVQIGVISLFLIIKVIFIFNYVTLNILYLYLIPSDPPPLPPFLLSPEYFYCIFKS